MTATERTPVAAFAYRDFICDHCGKRDTDHPDRRPYDGPNPWAIWCPNPRNPKVKRMRSGP